MVQLDGERIMYRPCNSNDELEYVVLIDISIQIAFRNVDADDNALLMEDDPVYKSMAADTPSCALRSERDTSNCATMMI